MYSVYSGLSVDLKKILEGDSKATKINFPKDSSMVESLSLKTGAFVMITKNIDQSNGLVNGRQAIFLEVDVNKNLVIETLNGIRHSISKQTLEFNSYHI